MARLVGDADGKVFLILDRLRVHRARHVQGWLAGRCFQIEVFHLPARIRSVFQHSAFRHAA